MLQTGIVKKTHKNTAEIEIIRSTACGDNCASCGLCPGKTAIISAKNEIGAANGDTVLIDMSDKKVLGAAFLVYIVPIILLIVGYIAGRSLFGSETAAIISGFILMLAAFGVLIIADRKLKQKYMSAIVKIM